MKNNMLLALLLLLLGGVAVAQVDPTVMTVNGVPVPRSEFEYSYNKNNSETVVDKKSVNEYVDLFINYKLKVLAAQAAGIDTTRSFKSEFKMYRDQQLRPSFITDADVEAEARRIYKETSHRIDSLGGLVHPAHILVLVRQKATKAQQDSAKLRADSIYTALKRGADFATLARKCSDDKRSAIDGGDLSWIQRGQTLKEFEEKVYAMKKGELSRPFLSPVGYHIVLLKDKGNFFPYDSVHADILRFIDQRNLRDRIVSAKIDSIAKASVPACTPEDVLDRRSEEMQAKDPDLRNLIREYHDGLMLYEISNRTVWDKAAKDTEGLASYFKKNKKKYQWDTPRFKGISCHLKNEADIKRVKDVVKNLPFDQWGEALRKTFNDSTVTIKVVKGIFKEGDNALVDHEIFGKDTELKPVKGYPYTLAYGEKLKAPKTYEDVRDQVVADYQDYLEKQWVESLRRQYPVTVDKAVLETVNKH